MGCVTLVVVYDQHDQKSGDLHFWKRMGNSFCMDPYAGDSKAVDSRPNQVRALGYSKAGKVDGRLKLEEGHGQKISIKGAERNAPAKVEVGERTQQWVISQTGNWDVQRCHLFGAANTCSSYLEPATSQTPNWKD